MHFRSRATRLGASTRRQTWRLSDHRGAVALRWLIGFQVAAVAATVVATVAQSENTPPQEVVRKLDQLMDDYWRSQKVRPSPPTDDATFLRRLSLDVAGVIPSADEVIAFAGNHKRDKRAAAIDALLDSPLYVEHWTDNWVQFLIGSPGRNLPGVDRGTLKEWLREAIRINMPYNRLVYALLTADGNTEENGAANFLARYENNTPDLAGKAASAFLGQRIQCVQCHNDHMGGTLKQTDFWGIVAYFAQTRVRNQRSKDGSRRQYAEIIDTKRGEAHLPSPKDDVIVKPQFFLPVSMQPDANASRRRQLAELITSPADPAFARAYVNRIWFDLIGRGIVEPCDDMRAQNPPFDQQVLDLLANDFVQHGYDMKRLLRILLNSKVYQLSSDENRSPDATVDFARARLRPLSPNQLFYSVLRATSNADALAQRRRESIENMKVRYLQNFVRFYTTDEVSESVEFDGTILQSLWMMNGDIIQESISSKPGTSLNSLLTSTIDDADKLRYLYLRVLSRYPTPAESRTLLSDLDSTMAPFVNADSAPALYGNARLRHYEEVRQQLQQQQQKMSRSAAEEQKLPPGEQAYRKFWEDVVWAMLNSSEFVFNH